MTMGKRITKVVTRTGDDGSTGLADGTRLPKSAPRIAALGSLDELNCWIGLLRSVLTDARHDGLLAGVQQSLFDLGGELALPGATLLEPAALAVLDAAIEALNTVLPALDEFILPAGSEPVCRAHVARSVARRAERDLVALAAQESVSGLALQYLNRLSDLLFVLARTLGQGEPELPWDKPARRGRDA